MIWYEKRKVIIEGDEINEIQRGEKFFNKRRKKWEGKKKKVEIKVEVENKCEIRSSAK